MSSDTYDNADTDACLPLDQKKSRWILKQALQADLENSSVCSFLLELYLSDLLSQWGPYAVVVFCTQINTRQ